VYLEGMSEEERVEVAKKIFDTLPMSQCPKYGPPFEPPWLVFPDYEMYSMGFRMGSGEDYNIQFSNWYNFASEKDITDFQRKYPEIEKYAGYYANRDKRRNEVRMKNDQ